MLNIVSKNHHHPSPSFRCWYNCVHGTKVRRQGKRMWLNAGKTHPSNWSLVVGPISRVLARPSPYNTAYAASQQTQVYNKRSYNTVSSATPTPHSTHRSHLLQPLPRLALHVDCRCQNDRLWLRSCQKCNLFQEKQWWPSWASDFDMFCLSYLTSSGTFSVNNQSVWKVIVRMKSEKLCRCFHL